MNYETMNDYAFSHLTFKQGFVLSTYAELCETFGKPLPGDGYRTRAEWVVVFKDEHGNLETVATIYDWRRDEPLDKVTFWSVGGHKHEAVECVEAAIDYVKDMNNHDYAERMEQWDFEWAEQEARASYKI